MRESDAVRKAVAASQSPVAQVARDALARGNAVDAVVAGILMAAAESSGVLLGPVQLLVGGAGAGLLALDGRVRQPGRGAARPRGFLEAEPVPESARVGVPALPAALATALASLGTVTLLRAAGPAIARARACSVERAGLIQAFARRGAPSLADHAVAAELLAAGGRAARGLLTEEDLVGVRPVVVRCHERTLGPSGVLTVPWRVAFGDATNVQVVAAADGRGMLAIACYETREDGVAVPALGVVAPPTAAPVMRGHKRVSPGEPRPAAAPIALTARRGIVELAVGIAAAADAERSLDAVTGALGQESTLAEALAEVRGCAVALARSRDSVRVLASTDSEQ
jgi:hypothetical protein